MQISLKTLQELFAKLPSKLLQAVHPCPLSGWSSLREAQPPYLPDRVYMCTGAELSESLPSGANMQLICLLEDWSATAHINLPEEGSILFLQTNDMDTVCHSLQEFFTERYRLSIFSADLLDILASGGGIQAMVDYAYPVFGNPIAYFDSAFNLVAANWEEAKRLNIGLKLMENRGFSDREFEMANSRNHIHKRVLKSEVPIPAHNPELGYDQLLYAIDTQKDLGHLVVSAANRPLLPLDTELLKILKKCIFQQLQQDEFVRNSRGFNYEAFLRDLLDEKIATGKSFLTRLQYACRDFTGNLYCLVVETARSANTVNTYHIRSLLESNLPNFKTLIYNGQIVGIWIRPKDEYLAPELLETARQLCGTNDLYAGISNCFQNLIELSDFYKQALRAIELGICTENHPNLFCYGDHFFEHLKNIFTQKESARTFCHPKMKLLLDYDKEHGSDLAYTLYIYLMNERNTVTTAAAMFMHRNSIVYRVRKITSLIGDDFDDYFERQYLILSYKLTN